MMGKKEILILGGAGFGGSALTRRLVDRGYGVTVLDHGGPNIHGANCSYGIAGE
ncbi:MAG: NAD-dependent epimerase/dehydratase family protein [Candidatus Odinarchaeota archaeon]